MTSAGLLRVLPITVVLLTVSSAADAENVRISWGAPAACPSQARFVDEVTARTANAQFSANGDRLFRVTITQDGKIFRGRLEILQGTNVQGSRDIDSDQCPELVSALALLTALAIDPNASSASLSVALPAKTPAPQAPASVSVQPPAPVLAPAIAQNPPPKPPISPKAQSKSQPWHLSLEPGLSMDFGPAPAVLPGFEVLAELWQQANSPLTHNYQLALGYSSVTKDNLRLSLYKVRANACPLRSPISSAFFLQACAGLQAGRIHSEAVDIANHRESDNFWFATSLGPRFGFSTGRFSSSLFVGMLVPLSRYRFYTDDPWIQLHQMPTLGLTLNFNVGIRFF
jgi:hypothetical protein